MADLYECTFSPCRRYRYRWRAYSRAGQHGGDRRVVWCMLNPSTADEQGTDPTVRRCLSFSALWGYTRVEVINLFAWRSTSPRALYAEADPVGPENDWHIVDAARGADLVVCAWGVHGALHGRGDQVRRLLGEVCHPMALRLTAGGEPGHPLYLPGDLLPWPL